MFSKPPAWARRLLQFCCNPQLLESIEGDFNELFQERLLTHGARHAKRAYALDVIRAIGPYWMQYPRLARSPAYDGGIFHNYQKDAWRNPVKNGLYRALNLVALSVACALCLLVYASIQSDRSFDTFHEKANARYRIETSFPGELAPRMGGTLNHYVLGSIAILVLLIAGLHYVSLSITREAGRLREAGVRELNGAARRRLMVRFWLENALLVAFAAGMGLALALLTQPLSGQFVENPLPLAYLHQWPVLAGLVVLLSTVTGFYPALLLAGFGPSPRLQGGTHLPLQPLAGPDNGTGPVRHLPFPDSKPNPPQS